MCNKKFPSFFQFQADGFTREVYQICKKELTQILYNHFEKIEEKTFSISLYEVSITLIPK